jgi:surface antigen
MRTAVLGVVVAVAVAGCTAQSPPPQPYYGANYAPPPPRSNTVLGDSCGELGWGKVAGAAIGGAAGGAIVSNIARGSGSGVATAAGVIGGMLLGGFAGSNVDKVNCTNARAAQAQALQPATPIGQPIQWNDPQSGAHGSFTPTREGRQADGAYCREYTQTIIVGGRQEQGIGRACQQPDGSWKTVG